MNLEQRFEQGAGRRQSAGRVRFYGTECRRNPHLRLIDRRFEEYLPTFVLKGLRPSDLRYERLVSFDRATTGAFPEDNDRGRERLLPSPPSEPCVRFSRTRLSSRWFPHRDWLASFQAVVMVNSPWAAKN